MNPTISDLRQEYCQQGIDQATLNPNPFEQFRLWFDQVCDAGLLEPNAMTLATVSAAGKPSARMVLLKDFDQRGFTFFTNYSSRKGEQLAQTPFAALVFWWAGLERQVRVEGSVEKVSDQESDDYFQRRPWGSRLGAWVSDQSQPIGDLALLDQRLQALETKYKDQEIPRPSHWGGYRVMPTLIEFWQGRPNRLHDRLCYRRQAEDWIIERLSP